MPLMRETFENLIEMVVSMEIKYSVEAKSNETIESAMNSDRYISALSGVSTKYTYSQYDIEAIKLAGIVDLATQTKYHNDKNSIPDTLLPSIIAQQDIITINNYVEYNNYYRKLNGLPNVDDSNFIYIDEEVANKYFLDASIPIHMMTLTEQILLTNVGEVNRLISLHPDKLYLNYLGSKKIDILTARNARSFAIMQTNITNINETLVDLFLQIYESSREYFTTILYVKEFESSYDYYDNFIALMIAIMTIQRTMNEIFKYSITTDFYDIEIIKNVFEQYRVPFIESVPLDYQRKLVKSLNQLIRLKSTDKVIYDITSILGFDTITVFKYYLIKNQKLNNEGELLFEYQKDEFGNIIYDEDGNPLMNNREMYDFYFQSVDLKEDNFIASLTKEINTIEMNQVILDDPYWIEDEDLLNFISDEEFNYMETKYIAFQAMYKMSEMVFDMVHVVSLLMSNKEKYPQVYYINRLLPDVGLPLFQWMVILCALVCKKTNFDKDGIPNDNGLDGGIKYSDRTKAPPIAGNIIYGEKLISTIMGFDFTENLILIINEIESNPLLDSRLAIPLRDILIDNGSPNTAFTGIKDFNELITEIMYSATDRKVYMACQELYKTLMTKTETVEAFRDHLGNIPKTFLDYINIEITEATSLFTADKTMTDYTTNINFILDMIDKEVEDLKNIYYINEVDSGLLEAMIRIVNYFKSYTVDVHNVNVLYILDDKRLNTFKFFMGVHQIFKELFIIDKPLKLKEQIEIFKTLLLVDEIIFKKETFDITAIIEINEQLNIEDRVTYTAKVLLKDLLLLSYSDQLDINSTMSKVDNISFSRDEYVLTTNTNFNDTLTIKDVVKLLMIIDNDDILPLKEKVAVMVDVIVKDKFPITEKITINLSDEIIEDLLMFERGLRHKTLQIDDDTMTLSYADSVDIQKTLSINELDFKPYDLVTKITNISNSESLKFKESFKIITS